MEKKAQLSAKKTAKRLTTGYGSSDVFTTVITLNHHNSMYIDTEMVFVHVVYPLDKSEADVATDVIEAINAEITQQEKTLAERKERAAIMINNLNSIK